MTKNIKGKIKFVAKTNGIKLEGDETWYNPVDQIQDRIEKNLVGKNVELIDITGDNNKFMDIKVLDLPEGKLDIKEEYVGPDRFDKREKRDFMQMAITNCPGQEVEVVIQNAKELERAYEKWCVE